MRHQHEIDHFELARWAAKPLKSRYRSLAILCRGANKNV